MLLSAPNAALRRAAALSLAALVAAACGGDSGSEPTCTVSALTVNAPAGQVVVGRTTTMTANITQFNCTPAATASWSSNQPTIASVDPTTGVVTGIAPGGPVTITASAGGRSGTAQVTVIQPPVGTVTVAAQADPIALGETRTIAPVLRDDDNNVLTGRTVTWSTSDAAIAAVNATTGQITPVAPGGPVTITATSEGKSGSTQVTIIAARAANRFAYAWANDASAAAPYEPDASYAFNATAGAISITRGGTGRYTVTFARLGKGAGDKETILVTPYVSTARCGVGGWSTSSNQADLVVQVHCNTAAGAAVDSRFTIMVVGAGSLTGRSAFAWANDPASADYAPNASYAWSSGGEAPRITRSADGVYNADLKAPRPAGGQPENYFVTAYGNANRNCKIASWGGTVNVRCFDNAGTAADAQYDVLAVEGGRTGRRLGFAWANDPASATYTPDAGWSRSTGGAITITRASAGAYDVVFAGLGKTGNAKETMVVSAYGPAYSYCSVGGWGNVNGNADLQVRVNCTDGAGNPVDSRYQIMIIE